MVSGQPVEEWHGGLEEAQFLYEAAQRADKKARRGLGEARSRYERARSMHEQARSKEEKTRSSIGDARRQAESARRRREMARRSGSPHLRWETEARRWDSEARRAMQELPRWQDEVRRKERDLRPYAQEVKNRIAEHEVVTHEIQDWEQKIMFLAQFGDDAGPLVSSTPDGEFKPLSITERVPAALMDILVNMERGPDHALRLVWDSIGSFTLALDVQREGDEVVSHQGAPVLFVESPLPEGLQGNTLDVDESLEVPKIMLSR